MQNAWLPLQQLDRPIINVGGLCYFYFTPIEDVLLWPAINPITASITDEIVLKENKTWYKCDVINVKRSYSEKQQSMDAGNFIECQVTGTLPDDFPAIAYSINQMRYHQYAIVLKERNGMMRLVGNQYYGAYFNADYDSSDNSGTRERVLTFTWQSEDSAPLYLCSVVSEDSIIVPPWYNSSSESEYVSKLINTAAVGGQSDYTFNELIDKELMLVCVPPVVMYASSLQDQYIFNKSTGTIHFNYPLSDSQKIIIMYNDPV